MSHWLRWILRIALPRPDRAELLIELEELHRARCLRHGRLRADLWAVRAGLGFVLRLAPARLTVGLDGVVRDARRALRALRHGPGWAAAAILTLGLGAGGVATVHAVADWVLLRDVAGVRAPHQLVEIRQGARANPRPVFPVAQSDLEAFRAGIPGLSSLEARIPLDVNLALGDGLPMRATIDVVTPGWFTLLGVSLRAGRLPSTAVPAPAGPDRARDGGGSIVEVVASGQLARRLGSTPADALGRHLRINGRDAIIVGITPTDFSGVEIPGRTDAWLPASALPVIDPDVSPGIFESFEGVWPRMVGRLSPGATADGVEASANRIRDERRAARVSAALIPSPDFGMQVVPRLGLDPALRPDVRRTLTLLGAASGLLLLLATANVAGLSLSRSVSQRSVGSVKRALGAGPVRLAREVVVEHLLLGAAGGVTAFALALGAGRVLSGVRLDSSGAALAGMEIDARTAALATAVAVATALLAALGPIALAVRPARISATRHEPRGTVRLRRTLAATQVALSVVLAVGAGLMARTVINLSSRDPGFDPRDILAFDLDPSRLGLDSDASRALLERLTAALADDPAVAAAGAAFPQPLWGAYITAAVRAEGTAPADAIVGAHLQVAGDFLGAMNLPFVAGRDFLPSERRAGPGSEGVVILSVDLVEQLFPTRSPASVIGSRIVSSVTEAPLRIVGVIPVVRRRGPRVDPPPSIIRPWSQSALEGVTSIWVRARAGLDPTLSERVRRIAGEVAPEAPIFDLRSVEAQTDRLVAGTRIVTGLATTTSLLGLLLAALGLYGVLAYGVAARQREIGVRAALGADRPALVGDVLRRGIGLALVGLSPGILGALAFARILESRLFGVGMLDPVAWCVGVGLLLVVATLASWIPAWRATRVEVVQVLNSD